MRHSQTHDYSNCVKRIQDGGIISFCKPHKDYCNLTGWKPCPDYEYEKRNKLTRTVDINQTSFTQLQDDGKPLENEYLRDLQIKKEKWLEKERKIIQEYQEKAYKNKISEMEEHTDDLYDSKGYDISDKEFLRNQADLND